MVQRELKIYFLDGRKEEGEAGKEKGNPFSYFQSGSVFLRFYLHAVFNIRGHINQSTPVH